MAGAATGNSHRHIALGGRPQPALRLESVSLPSMAFTGEQFPIDVVVSTPRAGMGE